jgi:hypothetical protein
MDTFVTPARAGVITPMLEASVDVLIFNPSPDATTAGPVINSPAAKTIECPPASSAALAIAQSICSHDEVMVNTFARWQLPKTALPEAACKTPMGLDFPEKKRVGNKTEILPST